MSIARNFPASLCARCAPVRRFLAFFLLALALLSYGSLPSPNLGFLLQTTPIADASHDSEQVLVPQQANEYRGRDWLAVIDHRTDKQGEPILHPVRTALRHDVANASNVSLDECAITQTDLKSARLARGPPATTTA